MSCRAGKSLACLIAISCAIAFAVAGQLPAVAGRLAISPVGCQPGLGTRIPVLMVHGFTEGPEVWTKDGSPPMSQAISKALGAEVSVVAPFDYSSVNTKWVTNASIAPALAARISCLATASTAQGGPGVVILVAHSMGGLAIRCAVDPRCVGQGKAADPQQIGLVITLGTPNIGPEPYLSPLVQACHDIDGCSSYYAASNTEAAKAMMGLAPGSKNPTALAPLPSSVPLDALAGKITLTTTLFGIPGVFTIDGDTGDIGDGVVSVQSAQDPQGVSHPGPGAWTPTLDCGSVPLDELPQWAGSAAASGQQSVKCWHLNETTSPVWQADVITAIQDYLNLTACTSKALTRAVVKANPQLNGLSWKLTASACGGDWAVAEVYAPTVGYGIAFLRQTPAEWTSAPLGEVNCSDIPGSLGSPLPPLTLAVSLLSKARICSSGNAFPSSSLPDFYYANAVLPEKLYVSPEYPKELAIDNHDGIAIKILNAWGPQSMTMTGTLAYDECQPDCAAGPTVTFPVQVIATAPQTCTLQVDQASSTVPERAYVYSEITVKALSGNPPPNLVGTSVFKACGANTSQGSTPPGSQPCASATAEIIPGNCTPQDAVDGLLTSELAGNWTQACSYIVPSSQPACTQQVAQASLPPATGNATVDGAMISGSEALVEVTGTLCVSGGCNSNSYPGTGMPQSQDTFTQVYDQVLSSGSGSMSPVPCIEENGLWYVNAMQ